MLPDVRASVVSAQVLTLYGVRESEDETWDVIVAGRTVDSARSDYAARQKLRHLRDQAVRDCPPLTPDAS